MARILVVEDDVDIQEMLGDMLSKKGYEVLKVYSGLEAMELLSKNLVDLMILDLMLPGMSGEEIISKVRGIPTIVLSAKSHEGSKVECLLAGASDYVTKPFSKDELLARIEVQLRKNGTCSDFQFGELRLDEETRTLFIKEKGILLTKTECAIMEVLLSNPHAVATKSCILKKIAEYAEDCDESSLKVHIFNIRKKMKRASNREYIESVYGIGFKLME